MVAPQRPNLGAMWKRLLAPVALAGTLALTALIRIPILISDIEVTFDEGVYGASVMAMRGGAAPFRDVFSSQGPLFLPLLWLFDLAGLRHVRAIRIGMIVAALAVTLGTYVLVRRVASRWLAILAALVTGTSSALLAAAGPVQSDGFALAFVVWAVAVAAGSGPFRRSRPFVAGALVGAAVAVKSVFAGPGGLAVAWLFLARREGRELAAATATGVAVLVLSALPWGLANVWEQFVAFQLDAPRNRNPLRSLHRMGESAWTEEGLVLALAAAGVLTAVWRRARGGRLVPERPPEWGASVAWLVATLVMLLVVVGFGRGFDRFFVFVIPPLLMLAALLRPAAWLAVLLVAVMVPVHYLSNDKLMWRRQTISVHEEVTDVLRAMPAGAEVITDRPGLAWGAERHPPPPLVDVSWARIRSRDITSEAILAASRDRGVCAVLFYSKRFDFLDRGLENSLEGYTLYDDWDEGRRLWLKDSCRVAVASPGFASPGPAP